MDLVQKKSIKLLLLRDNLFQWRLSPLAHRIQLLGLIILFMVKSTIGNTKTLKVQLSNQGEVPYLENSDAGSLASLNKAILGQLLKVNSSSQIESDLLEAWEYNYSTEEYVLRLKPGIIFHNGRAANSKDLEFAILRGFFSPNRNFYNIYLNNLYGIEKVTPGTEYKTGKVSGVKIKDDRSITIKLSNQNPSFLYALTNPFFSLVPIEELQRDYINWKSSPVGAGNYKVSNVFKDGQLRLKRVSKESKTAPSEIVIFTKTQTNESIDLSTISPDQTSLTNAANFNYPKSDSVVTIFFNNAHPLYKDEAFKKTLKYGINREALTKGRKNLTPTTELLPQHFWGRGKSKDDYNPALAKKYSKLINKKYIGTPIQVASFGTSISIEKKEIYNLLSEQLKEYGIKLNFESLPEKFLSDNSAKKFALKISGRVADYVDPLIMFASFLKSSPYRYERPLDLKHIEKLYDSAASSKDYESRINRVKELSDFVYDNMVAIPLYESHPVIYYSTKTIKSLGNQPQPLIVDFEEIEFK